ncbi:helix-turn-helix domain-containing protein [Clostridium scatologenes]|uniref:Transcriptional regulator n=1 Tax=Clostridium scatologenes TaxID=1548 RepID=A0A0E3JZN9_CLOSL|nr:helix-turn-helix transcriptional regulator [Clostridium scatologenes]AKA68495.1 transcriptional regulator [Clostridium scatologenes]
MTLKELRKQSGLKAYKIAEMLGISRAQLNNLEKGKYKMDKLKIEKLSEVYCKEIKEIKLIVSKGGEGNV